MNSFDSKATLSSGNRTYTIYRLPALKARGFNLSRLPFSLKILLENLLAPRRWRERDRRGY